MQADYLSALSILLLISGACDSQTVADVKNETEQKAERVFYDTDDFVMGADLSYVNQILDHGGVYKDSGSVTDPYVIFEEHGANVVRLRLFHDPEWTKEVYGGEATQMYNDLQDVEKSIRRSKNSGVAVNLDFHYSDIWADPGDQEVPEAWEELEFSTIKDSVYAYTYQTLDYLARRGLMPEMVQVGNEINCGMLFPYGRACGEEGSWEKLGALLNSGIRAVRDISKSSDIKPQIILHVAQPENVEWWFDNAISKGEVTDFDIVGFSYYAPWSDVPLDEISTYVSTFRQKYQRTVMIMETAYSWTMENADNYSNIFGRRSLVAGYPATPEGQRNYLINLTQEVIDGGGKGLFYWAPAWITSDVKDLWGTGSSWENNTFFDFEGNVHEGMDFMTYPYDLE